MRKSTKKNNNIEVNEPVVSDTAKKNVAEALRSGWLSSAGPFVEAFERQFAGYVGMPNAIAVSSGTAALHVALLALGVGAGDEVIVPAFAMGACFLSVLFTGARPVFVDCEPETYNIDPAKIEEKITSRTKAILVVHTYGHPAAMDEIAAIAKKRRLPIIEDAAEAHGARYKGKNAGSFGTISCFSFYANKIITTGEGGMALTADSALAEEMRRLKDLYHSKAKRFIHEKIGYNYRMTNLQAAVGLGELAHIDEYLARKRAMAKRYAEGLSRIRGLRLPATKANAENVFWVYGVVVDEKEFGMNRDALREKLSAEGIGTRDFFYPPESQPVLAPFLNEENFPSAAYLSANGLYLPSGLALTEEQADRVIEAVKKAGESGASLSQKGS